MSLLSKRTRSTPSPQRESRICFVLLILLILPHYGQFVNTFLSNFLCSFLEDTNCFSGIVSSITPSSKRFTLILTSSSKRASRARVFFLIVRAVIDILSSDIWLGVSTINFWVVPCIHIKFSLFVINYTYSIHSSALVVNPSAVIVAQ